jgi:hypothetical protein
MELKMVRMKSLRRITRMVTLIGPVQAPFMILLCISHLKNSSSKQ